MANKRKQSRDQFKARKALVMPDHPQLSLIQPCQLLQIARSSLYYQPKAPPDEELELLRLIDQPYLETPCYGSRKMTIFLQPCGYRINRNRT